MSAGNQDFGICCRAWLKGNIPGPGFRGWSQCWTCFRALLVFTTAQICPSADTTVPAFRIRLESPLDYEVFQRSSRTAGRLIIAGTVLSVGGKSWAVLERQLGP